jgi:hypothetical protein
MGSAGPSPSGSAIDPERDIRVFDPSVDAPITMWHRASAFALQPGGPSMIVGRTKTIVVAFLLHLWRFSIE